MEWFFYPQKLILIEAEMYICLQLQFLLLLVSFSRSLISPHTSYDFLPSSSPPPSSPLFLFSFTFFVCHSYFLLFAIHSITLIYSLNETFILALWIQRCDNDGSSKGKYRIQTNSFHSLFVYIFIQVERRKRKKRIAQTLLRKTVDCVHMKIFAVTFFESWMMIDIKANSILSGHWCENHIIKCMFVRDPNKCISCVYKCVE